MGKVKLVRMVKLNSKGKPVGKPATYAMANLVKPRVPKKKKPKKKATRKKRAKKRKRKA